MHAGKVKDKRITIDELRFPKHNIPKTVSSRGSILAPHQHKKKVFIKRIT